MTAISADVALNITRQSLRHLHLELPEALAADLADIESDLARRERLRHDPAALRDAVSAALAADKDPATDKAVLIHLAREQLARSNVGHMLEEAAERRRADALTEHAPAVVELLAPVVADASTTLAAVRERIPDVDLSNRALLNSLRPMEMGPWAQAQDALNGVREVEQVWSILAVACRLVSLPDGERILILADLSAEELAELGGQDALAAAYAGRPLSLATFDGFAKRVARVNREQAEAERHQVEAERRQQGATVAGIPASEWLGAEMVTRS